jgi:nucleoside transporter
MSDMPEDPATRAALIPDGLLETTPTDVPSMPLGRHGEGVGLSSAVGFKLATILFLHNACLGSWFVTLSAYVNANSGVAGLGLFGAGFIGVAYSAAPIGGMVSPVITGLMADHWFAAERLILVLQLLCAATLAGAVAAPSQELFFAALVAYFLCLHPSNSLATSMALHHLRRPERDFPVVRACGTAGWVVAGLFVGLFWPWATGKSIEATDVPMRIAIGVSLITAAFSLTLPHTPPLNRRLRSEHSPLPSKSQLWELVRDWRFAALLVLAVAAHVPTQFYYAYSNVYFRWTQMEYAAAKMTLGQVVEVGVMLLLPAVLVRVSVRTAIVAGMGIWTLRFGMMAIAASPPTPRRDVLLYAAIMLHGVAFTLVTISMQLEVDRCAGPRRRATAQGLFSVAVQGLGCFAGAQLAGLAGAALLPIEVQNATPSGWGRFWLLAALGAAGVTLMAVVLLGRRPAEAIPHHDS